VNWFEKLLYEWDMAGKCSICKTFNPIKSNVGDEFCIFCIQKYVINKNPLPEKLPGGPEDANNSY